VPTSTLNAAGEAHSKGRLQVAAGQQLAAFPRDEPLVADEAELHTRTQNGPGAGPWQIDRPVTVTVLQYPGKLQIVGHIAPCGRVHSRFTYCFTVPGIPERYTLYAGLLSLDFLGTPVGCNSCPGAPSMPATLSDRVASGL
jgi:hypothetical protein